jgi:hypothetical protein
MHEVGIDVALGRKAQARRRVKPCHAQRSLGPLGAPPLDKIVEVRRPEPLEMSMLHHPSQRAIPKARAFDLAQTLEELPAILSTWIALLNEISIFFSSPK